MAKKAAAKKSATGKRRGRPPQTEEQKAAKKAAGAPAADPGKTDKKKPAKDKKASAAPVSFNSPVNPDEQRLFLSHLPIIAAQKAKLDTANSDLRNLYKKAKADGFDKFDFEIAMALETAEKEAKQKAKIARTLTIAKFCGKALGGQLDFFLEPDRTPAAENAYQEGKIASMKGESAKPGYDPSTEQFRQYMQGYHDASEERVKAGIKPTDDTPKGSGKDSEAKPAKPAAAPQGSPEPAAAPAPQAAPQPQEKPAQDNRSPMRMTKADYLREQELARQASERTKLEAEARAKAQASNGHAEMNGSRPVFAEPDPPVAEDDEGSMFKRRAPAAVS